MGRSSTTYTRKWKSSKTTVIRVPEVIADDLIKIARRIDEAGGVCVRDEPDGLFLQITRPQRVQYTADRPVNVASVPQRSPFRYPGGKTWFVPYLRDWLRSQKSMPNRFIEPFAGGAIVSLTVGFESLAKHVIFAEFDTGVAAVWRVVLNGQAEWLAGEILRFDLSPKNVKIVLSQPCTSLKDRAFQTIVRNRVQRGGIMAPGAGLVKTGENGRGLQSRWYPSTLARRIREINQLKERFTFLETDGFTLLEEFKADSSAVFFIDPPYTLAARRLYTQWEIDHRRLFEMMKSCKGDFLMTYDNTPEILALARAFGFESRPITMKNTHHARMTELLIGRNLDWVSQSQESDLTFD
jgi:DNA adenine methylase